MPLEETRYKPNIFMRHAHVHTIVPSLFRKVPFTYATRERVELTDGDFVDVDISRQGNKKAVLLCHGLEGSSRSQYVLGMAKALLPLGVDVLAVNHRSCSGEMNRLPRMYHHAAFEDMAEVLQKYAPNYDEIALVGFSLGANLIVHFLADLAKQKSNPLKAKIKAAVCFSAPLDLVEGVEVIHQANNKLYHDRFLKSIKKKMALKQNILVDLNLKPLSEIKTLNDLDDHYTAPLHGFKDGHDYHVQASCYQKLPSIEIPTLIIQALDDPFLSEGCFPIQAAKESKMLHLQLPKYGGHVGFSAKGEVYWSEQQAINFLQKQAIL